MIAETIMIIILAFMAAFKVLHAVASPSVAAVFKNVIIDCIVMAAVAAPCAAAVNSNVPFKSTNAATSP
ncbi:hypothetical protein D1872_327460 [compost metagenome]